MRIVFMGTPDFSVPCLQRLIADGEEVVGVFTQPDKPKGRGYTLTPPPVKAEASLQMRPRPSFCGCHLQSNPQYRFPVGRGS